MTTPTRPTGAKIAEAYQQYEESSGLVRLRGAADWILSGGARFAAVETIAEIEDALRDAIRVLPVVLGELSERAARAFIISSSERLDEVATEGWEILLLRDLAEDLAEAGPGVIGLAERSAMAAFDEALDAAEPWLVELDDARAAEARERRESGLSVRRWWTPTRPDIALVEPSMVLGSPFRDLLRPTPEEIASWRQSDLGDALAGLTEDALEEALPANVIRLRRGQLGTAVEAANTSSRAVAEGAEEEDARSTRPAPSPLSETVFELEELFDVQVGRWTAETLILSVVGPSRDFDVKLATSEGLRIAKDFGRVERRWWAEVREDRLDGARLTVAWGDETRELTIELE